MLSEREMHDWSPEVGDRIEVILSSGQTHAHGVFVVRMDGRMFLHCDGSYGGKEWPATFRPDQVRREYSIADRLSIAVRRLTTTAAPERQRRFWQRRDERAEAQREVDIETARAVIHHLATLHPPVNVADQIITDTADGVSRGDRVNIFIADRNTTGAGVFVAEYKGLRHVIFDGGGATAYPKGDVTKK